MLLRHNKANASWHSASTRPLFEGAIAQGLLNENSQYRVAKVASSVLAAGPYTWQ